MTWRTSTGRLIVHAMVLDLHFSAAADPQIADEARDRFLVVRRTALGKLLTRAVMRGEIASELVPLAIDVISDCLWYRLIFAVGPLDYGSADEIATGIVSK